MKLINPLFEDAFSFSRAVPGLYRDTDGDVVEAAIDAPRFDHSEGGAPLGLLVEPGATLGQADRCAVLAGDWEAPGPVTVLHEYADADGVIRRDAIYSEAGRHAVDGRLRIAGRHRIIAVAPGYLRQRDGVVTFRERAWQVQGYLGTGVDGEQLSDGEGRGLSEA